MANSSTSVKVKRFRQRFGISAPRLAISAHVAWYWRVMAVALILLVLFALAAWGYIAGGRIAGSQNDDSIREIQGLGRHVTEMDVELTKLRALSKSGESDLKMERATVKQLSWQVQALEIENSALKEDLAFFEGLVPTSDVGDEVGVRIDHFRVEPSGASGQFRYRMLVINNASRQAREFTGSLQLLVKVQSDGKDVMLTVPSETDMNTQHFRFEIKHFHRLEGVFLVPVGAEVVGVEARLLQDGIVRAKQFATLSMER